MQNILLHHETVNQHSTYPSALEEVLKVEETSTGFSVLSEMAAEVTVKMAGKM